MSSLNKQLTMAAVLGMASAVSIQAAAADPRYDDNEVIFDGCDQSVYHPDKVYEMRLNCDKTFVIKKHDQGRAYDLESIKIDHHAEIGFMKMQSDGNLVVYSVDDDAMWSSETSGNHGAYLTFQDDGNLVIYKDKVGGGRDSLWATDTHPGNQDYDYIWRNERIIDGCDKSVYHKLGGTYELRLQCNKQLVLKKEEDGFTHVIKTFDLSLRAPDAIVDHLVMQDDGNMVVYGTDREVMWSTGTNGNDNSHFEFQDDGNLVIYLDDGKKAIWNSNT